MRRFTMRDVLLVRQIAICAVLVTSSLVAVRGLVRSLHSNYGFQPQNAHASLIPISTWPATRATATSRCSGACSMPSAPSPAWLPPATSISIPLSLGGGDSYVYTDTTTDFRPTNYAADAMDYNISPGYLAAAGTHLLAGSDLTYDDKNNAPIAALVNRHSPSRSSARFEKAIGGHFKFWGGNRAEVVGVVEDGKYRTLTEDQMPAMFFSFQQHPESGTFLVVRSQRDPAGNDGGARAHSARPRLLASRSPSAPGHAEMDSALFAARVATVALGVLGLLGAMLAVTGIFGMASYVVCKRLRELGIRVALGAGRHEILRASLGRAFRLLAIGSVAGIVLGVLATRVLSFIVYQATPKDPFVLAASL